MKASKVIEVKKEGKKMDKMAELMSLPTMNEKPLKPKKINWNAWIFGSLGACYGITLAVTTYQGKTFISLVTLGLLFILYCCYRVVTYVERKAYLLNDK